ncbi:hypothetical protein [Snodgrassella sp.]|uniref:hypothetical protein n=1 Tax=Snodgrassella sp. TaxID=2815304 RepID=UPI00258355CD|nr:hypothetical protein [Snodgrassella sp.]MCO6525099.1 hypothetical protein [Snodgrassella sp.]
MSQTRGCFKYSQYFIKHVVFDGLRIQAAGYIVVLAADGIIRPFSSLTLAEDVCLIH